MNEPIPDSLKAYVASLPPDHLDKLKNDLNTQYRGGKSSADLVAAMVQVGWPQEFSNWFVGLVVLHGMNFALEQPIPPAQMQSTPQPGQGFQPNQPQPFQSQMPPQGGPYYGQGPYQQPPQHYYRAQPNVGNGNTEMILAWVFGGIGLLCCPVIFSVAGIILGNAAASKGNPSGRAAMWFSVATLVIGIVIGALTWSSNIFLHRF